MASYTSAVIPQNLYQTEVSRPLLHACMPWFAFVMPCGLIRQTSWSEVAQNIEAFQSESWTPTSLSVGGATSAALFKSVS
jgi:hypothetical protein